MGVLVVAFFWIPACAGMTRGKQKLRGESRNDEMCCATPTQECGNENNETQVLNQLSDVNMNRYLVLEY